MYHKRKGAEEARYQKDCCRVALSYEIAVMAIKPANMTYGEAVAVPIGEYSIEVS